MAPRTTVPEWTIVDFIHRGPWWTNRGESLPMGANSMVKVVSLRRDFDSQYHACPSAVDIGGQWVGFISG